MNGDARPENARPRRVPPPGYRPLTEEEKKQRAARMRERAEKGELDIFADPSDANRRRHPRRNSESSIRDKPVLDPEEERKRRERKHRESKRVGKSGKPSRRLDVIDKLDVTSIYGTGREYLNLWLMPDRNLTLIVFHHDGPFDACNPHRNRKGSRQAPMQAFPEGSLNMNLGGSGPVNKQIDLNQYHGRGQEAHVDFNEAAEMSQYAPVRPNGDRNGAFNTTARVEPLHGSESAGLGTSTFLEGAPASRAAIAQRETEYAQQQQAQQLSRKKSLAQRIRGNRSNTVGNRTMSPEGTPITPLDTTKSESNANPFFKDYDQEYEKKGQQIAEEQQKTEKVGRERAPSSPKRGPLTLERSKTADSTGPPEEGKEGKASGFLNRVKSLKGGRRARPERRDTSG
jgi:hypothetical protein